MQKQEHYKRYADDADFVSVDVAVKMQQNNFRKKQQQR